MDTANTIEMISVGNIRILNPRSRERKRYQGIIKSISELGLKIPIVVSRRSQDENGSNAEFDLVCGQGRLEAYIDAEEEEIPARVIDVSLDDRLLMSLIENFARRPVKRVELINEIIRLRDQGYSAKRIAKKIGASDSYITSVIKLHDSGEERLVRAVMREKIPVSIAGLIAESTDDADIQKAIMEAYESKEIPMKGILTIKNLLDQRRFIGKKMRTGGSGPSGRPRATKDSLVMAYRKETDRQKHMSRKARLCETRLVFLKGAFSRLLGDDNFQTLLRAERLESIPEPLTYLIGPEGSGEKET